MEPKWIFNGIAAHCTHFGTFMFILEELAVMSAIAPTCIVLLKHSGTQNHVLV